MKRPTQFLIYSAIVYCAFLLGRVSSPPRAAHAGENEKVAIDYSIENCLSVLDKSKAEESSAGWFYWFAPRELTQGLVLKMSEVRPQQSSHESHTHESEEILFVLEGKAEFTIKDQKKVVGPNASLYCPPGVKHRIRNAGDQPLRYLVIHSY